MGVSLLRSKFLNCGGSETKEPETTSRSSRGPHNCNTYCHFVIFSESRASVVVLVCVCVCVRAQDAATMNRSLHIPRCCEHGWCGGMWWLWRVYLPVVVVLMLVGDCCWWVSDDDSAPKRAREREREWDPECIELTTMVTELLLVRVIERKREF